MHLVLPAMPNHQVKAITKKKKEKHGRDWKKFHQRANDFWKVIEKVKVVA